MGLSDGVPVAGKSGSCPGEKKSGLPGTKRGSNVPGKEMIGKEEGEEEDRWGGTKKPGRGLPGWYGES